MRVIADTSPLIALEHLGHLDLLKQLYGTIWIPPAVHQELLRGSRRLGWPNPLREGKWVQVARQPIALSAHILRAEFGAGESEALALAILAQPSLLLVDEVAARRVAQALGLRYTGTLGILLKAKSAKLIPAVRPLLDQLIRHTFHLSEALYQKTLSIAGE